MIYILLQRIKVLFINGTIYECCIVCLAIIDVYNKQNDCLNHCNAYTQKMEYRVHFRIHALYERTTSDGYF